MTDTKTMPDWWTEWDYEYNKRASAIADIVLQLMVERAHVEAGDNRHEQFEAIIGAVWRILSAVSARAHELGGEDFRQEWCRNTTDIIAEIKQRSTQ